MDIMLFVYYYIEKRLHYSCSMVSIYYNRFKPPYIITITTRSVKNNYNLLLCVLRKNVENELPTKCPRDITNTYYLQVATRLLLYCQTRGHDIFGRITYPHII